MGMQPGIRKLPITPRFAPTSTPELLQAVQRLREEFPDTWLHTHLMQTPPLFLRQMYPVGEDAARSGQLIVMINIKIVRCIPI
jgi:cytosine/adenosine deaminase-related metal-dependent hydrolase